MDFTVEVSPLSGDKNATSLLLSFFYFTLLRCGLLSPLLFHWSLFCGSRWKEPAPLPFFAEGGWRTLFLSFPLSLLSSPFTFSSFDSHEIKGSVFPPSGASESDVFFFTCGEVERLTVCLSSSFPFPFLLLPVVRAGEFCLLSFLLNWSETYLRSFFFFSPFRFLAALPWFLFFFSPLFGVSPSPIPGFRRCRLPPSLFFLEEAGMFLPFSVLMR